MNQQLRTYLNQQADELDRDLQEALEACGGNPMSALRALLIANSFLMEDNERLKAQVSAGFARGRVKKVPAKPDAPKPD